MSETESRSSRPIARRTFLGVAAAGTTTLLTGRAFPALERLSLEKGRHQAFRMVVIGDSIMWGQGLRDAEKFWYQTKQWLEHELRRPISADFFAHSGARIESYAYLDAQSPLYGEIPSPSPSVIRQAQYVKDPQDVNFVLLDGGANDVGLMRVMSEMGTPEWITEQARTKCGERMRAMLCYLVGYFPNARFVVTGYYPLVSEQSFAAVDALVALFQRLYGFDPIHARIYAKQKERLLAKSYGFANESSKWLRWAVDETNALFPNRVVFAKPAIDGDRCLLAPDSHIWALEEDPVRSQRIQQCQAAGQLTLIDFEDMSVASGSEMMDGAICTVASVMHPNAKGSRRYFEAIIAELPAFIPVWQQ